MSLVKKIQSYTRKYTSNFRGSVSQSALAQGKRTKKGLEARKRIAKNVKAHRKETGARFKKHAYSRQAFVNHLKG